MKFRDEILTTLDENSRGLRYQNLMETFQVGHLDRNIRPELRNLIRDGLICGDLHSGCMIKLTSKGRGYLREGGRCETGSRLLPQEPAPQAVRDDKPKPPILEWIKAITSLIRVIWDIISPFIFK